jgi:hypothetical protein
VGIQLDAAGGPVVPDRRDRRAVIDRRSEPLPTARPWALR